MEKRIIEYLLIPVLILLGSGSKAQTISTVGSGESLNVFSDRTLYIAGEKILFSAFLSCTNSLQADDSSRILYCELITPDGNRITEGKYHILNFKSQGCLPIPEKCITGIYFIKCYTRLMRNGNPSDYSYTMLKIINPEKAEVLAGRGDSIPGNSSEKYMLSSLKNEELQLIGSDKKYYHPGDSIGFHLNVGSANGHASRYTLSIAPSASCNFPLVAGRKDVSPLRNEIYYPETKGVSLSGRVLKKEGKQPVPGIKVNLSILGDRDVLAVRTDTSGRFFFALPDHEGSRDIFLCTENQSGISSEIYIDNDFCTKPVKLPSPIFGLSREERETAYKFAVNARLTELFDIGEVAVDTTDSQVYHPFYGQPADILKLENYISMPTMEDFFRELPVMVQVRKHHGQRYFRYLYPQTEMSIYEPLVLIDWVAVEDIERLLAVSPQKIDRIEFVNATYVKGNITYGGIISFISKANDFAGIDLPSSGTFINYSFLKPCISTIPTQPGNDNHPDSRNTVYWNPDISFNDQGKTQISVSAPGTPGKYLAILRGINSKGEMIFQSLEIEITE